MRALRKGLLLLCLTGSLAAAATAPAGASEPFFPQAGNGGYEVHDYSVRIAYRGDGSIRASTALQALTHRRLARFTLDFVGPDVRGVRVNGAAAGWRRRGGKLAIEPASPVAKGTVLAATIRYDGTPPKVIDPDGTEEGWYRTDDGVIAIGEPQGTAAWIPCNNVPADKASFEFEVTVPRGLKAVANGRLRRVERVGGRTRFTWEEEALMSPYLALLGIGRGRLIRGEVGDLPTWTLIDPRMEPGSRRVLAALPEIVRFQARLFGGYPFDSAGSIVDFAPGLGYALESQSRPIYAFVPDRTTVVHETAHQWFGDSVGLERWPQIWLNEGLATWVEWYYAELHGGPSAAALFRELLRTPASKKTFWNPPPGRPGSAKGLFRPSIYVRGGMALQALREKIGTTALLRILRRWAVDHRFASATIEEFAGLAEEVSGRELDPFFHRWLFRRGKP
ncbi:MAG TPA: M1 family metallopeptidase [Solirubrobacterales bacterium]|nr:M1 family metallopeptidase [Solirubrobacterales bacterium]